MYKKYIIFFLDQNNEIRKYELDNSQFSLFIHDGFIVITQQTTNYTIDTYIPMHRIIRITITTSNDNKKGVKHDAE